MHSDVTPVADHGVTRGRLPGPSSHRTGLSRIASGSSGRQVVNPTAGHFATSTFPKNQRELDPDFGSPSVVAGESCSTLASAFGAGSALEGETSAPIGAPGPCGFSAVANASSSGVTCRWTGSALPPHQVQACGLGRAVFRLPVRFDPAPSCRVISRRPLVLRPAKTAWNPTDIPG